MLGHQLPSCASVGNENGADARIQIGTGNPSIATELTEVQRYLKSSGLTHTMHSTGTTLGESC